MHVSSTGEGQGATFTVRLPHAVLRAGAGLHGDPGAGTPLDFKTSGLSAIALTAFARSEDRTRALRAGYLVHVSKPVEPSGWSRPWPAWSGAPAIPRRSAGGR